MGRSGWKSAPLPVLPVLPERQTSQLTVLAGCMTPGGRIGCCTVASVVWRELLWGETEL